LETGDLKTWRLYDQIKWSGADHMEGTGESGGGKKNRKSHQGEEKLRVWRVVGGGTHYAEKEPLRKNPKNRG